MIYLITVSYLKILQVLVNSKYLLIYIPSRIKRDTYHVHVRNDPLLIQFEAMRMQKKRRSDTVTFSTH